MDQYKLDLIKKHPEKFKLMVAIESHSGILNGKYELEAVVKGKLYRIDLKGHNSHGNIWCLSVIDPKTGRDITDFPEDWLYRYFKDVPFSVVRE